MGVELLDCALLVSRGSQVCLAATAKHCNHELDLAFKKAKAENEARKMIGQSRWTICLKGQPR